MDIPIAFYFGPAEKVETINNDKELRPPCKESGLICSLEGQIPHNLLIVARAYLGEAFLFAIHSLPVGARRDQEVQEQGF